VCQTAVVEETTLVEAAMSMITTVGLDLAKNVFQVHGIDVSGNIMIRRQLRRSEVLPFFRKLPACLVGMEACGTAHY
jgi:transposase